MRYEPYSRFLLSRPHSRLVLVLLTLASSVGWVGCGDPTEAPMAPTEPTRVLFRNATASVAYVGNQACRECHKEQFESHARGRHAHSFGTIEPGKEPIPGGFHHMRSGLSFDVGVEESRMVMREYLPGADGDETIQTRVLQAYLGSGLHWRTYVAELDGFQVPAPIVNFAEAGRSVGSETAAGWGILPGKDVPDRTSFDTFLSLECLACHVGRVERQDGRAHILEQAIGCESCHGPGALHVKHWVGGRSSDGSLDDTIANPARMSRGQAMDVCNRCHVTGQFTVPLPGKTLSDWRPGLLLRDFHIRFGGKHVPGDRTRRTYADQLRASACFQGSAELSCITCHRDHDTPPGAGQGASSREASFRSQCVSCHDPKEEREQGCGLALAQRRETSPDDNCVLCHMPLAEAYELHMPLHHHRIAVHGADAWATEKADAKAVVEAIDSVEGLSTIERDRAFGVANLLFSWIPTLDARGRNAFLDEAGARLERALDGGMEDPMVSGALALVYAARKQAKPRREAAEAALRSEKPLRTDVRVSVLRIVVASRLAEGELDRAREALEELVRLRRSLGDWNLMGALARAQDDKKAGVRAAEKMLEIGPHSVAAQWDAAELFRWAGQKERGDHHAKLGQRLEEVKERNR